MSKPAKKVVKRSKEQRKSMLLSLRDTYLRMGQTFRHSSVMNHIKSFMSDNKTFTESSAEPTFDVSMDVVTLKFAPESKQGEDYKFDQ